jgi:hypothetical protein
MLLGADRRSPPVTTASNGPTGSRCSSATREVVSHLSTHWSSAELARQGLPSCVAPFCRSSNLKWRAVDACPWSVPFYFGQCPVRNVMLSPKLLTSLPRSLRSRARRSGNSMCRSIARVRLLFCLGSIIAAIPVSYMMFRLQAATPSTCHGRTRDAVAAIIKKAAQA